MSSTTASELPLSDEDEQQWKSYNGSENVFSCCVLAELHFLLLICAQQMGLAGHRLSSSRPALLLCCSPAISEVGVWEAQCVPAKVELAGRSLALPVNSGHLGLFLADTGTW